MFTEAHGPGFNTLLALKVAHVQMGFGEKPPNRKVQIIVPW